MAGTRWHTSASASSMADDDRSARQIARSKQRKAGDRSARLAKALMQLSSAGVKKLDLDETLRDAVDRARAVTSLVARRRAERALAGDLRRSDLIEIEARLAKVNDSSNTDARQLHVAEQWRARMIEEGIAAVATFPGGGDEQLPRLIEIAQRERTTGKPPGAARALFRHIVELLKAPRASDEPADS
jgi:ribosome-associated protein